MPSPATGRPPSPQAQSPGRNNSLLSRIKAPFASKSRNVSEFYVQPDDPHRQYSPGDVITGSVVLKVLKPLRVTHVVVCLHGFVQVYKTPNNPGESYRAYTGSTTPGKTNRTGYFGNGFASLFQDEVVLCGEGRLNEGTYQFGFELVFPRERLPSSIDFERGTVAYMITATLTKPTAISPTTICDRKVHLTEDVDIAILRAPKPRVITLEPLTRRGRAKHNAKKRANATNGEGAAQAQAHAHSHAHAHGHVHTHAHAHAQALPEASTQTGSGNSSGARPDGDHPLSPAPSETSFDSCMSSCGAASAMDGTSYSVVTDGSNKHGHHHPHAQRPISATIELQRQGFLRGDAIHLRIFIQHRKLVKSLHGVIITLYRQARVDMHPVLPVVGKEGEKHEDYYPKSKTGLGGLSLSSAGSSHVFRKDLSQTFSSLIINPESLTADIKAAVRVPEEAFPTISSVPGSMISFKYYVEVVLDLHGKLSGLDRLFPSSGGMLTGYGPQAAASGIDNANGPMFSAWGGHLIDTQEIRREKGIVSCMFEVVVGTRDSQRVPGQRSQAAFQKAHQEVRVDNRSPALHPTTSDEPLPSQDGSSQYGYESYGDEYYYEYQYDDYGSAQAFRNASQSTLNAPPPVPPMSAVPLFEMVEEEGLTEKERLRRAEARLLPSQPPGVDEPESSTAARNVAPSAPALTEDPFTSTMLNGLAAPTNSLPVRGPSPRPNDNILSVDGEHSPRAPAYSGPSNASAQPVRGTSPHPANNMLSDDGPHTPTVPAYSGPSNAAALPTDDKAELHRRRLEMECSEPSAAPEQGGEHGPSAPPPEGHDEDDAVGAPTAPPLSDEYDDDDDDRGIGDAPRTISPLPRYER